MTPEQLKASILQRAMEGKLVPQDPNDEPASELLKRIKVEKEKLIKEGKIKRNKNETEIFRGDDGLHYEKFADGTIKQIEVPFEIPESWKWVRIQNLGTLIRGSGIKKSETISSGIGCVRYGELYTTYNYAFEKTVSFTSDDVAEKAKTIEYGDALFTLTGENNKDIGKTIVYLGKDKIVMGGDLTKLTYHSLCPRFLSFLLNSPYVVDQKARLATGNIIVHISNNKINSILVAIPPINEQKRIVSQVDSGFSKIDSYKKSYEVLDNLNKEFPNKLRKSILQHAMQGKLVPQDPNDEPVEVLLEKIRQEKQKLFEEGKLKKKDLEESIIYKGDDNSYYENIPETWVSTTLGNIGVWGAGATPSRSNPKYYGGSIPWLKTGDLTDSYVTEIPESITELALEKTSVKLNPTNSVLIAMYGATIGKLGILTFPATTNQACCACQPISAVNNWFLFYYLMSIRKQFIDSAEGGAQPNISKLKIVNTPFPMPSYIEQTRIVNQVEKAFDLVSQLLQ